MQKKLHRLAVAFKPKFQYANFATTWKQPAWEWEWPLFPRERISIGGCCIRLIQATLCLYSA